MFSDDLREFLKKPHLARISTLDPDGFPHTLPVWYAIDRDDLVMTITRNSRKFGYMSANSKASITIGGGRPSHMKRGWYVEPTVFADVSNDMKIAREESFGPVGVLIPYDTDEDAVRIANDSDYGLGGGVFSSDVKRAFNIARQSRSGMIGINQYVLEPNGPFGGFLSCCIAHVAMS